MDYSGSSSDVADHLPPIWDAGESLVDWENAVEDYLCQRLRETFADETPGGAQVLFDILLEHERVRPQHEQTYFMLLARYIIKLAVEMPELEGQAPALARLYCLLADEGERRGGDVALEEDWRFYMCDEHVYRDTMEREIVPPGFYNIGQGTVIYPDPNTLPPVSQTEMARLGYQFAYASRSSCFVAHVDAAGGFAGAYRNYPGSMGTNGWSSRRLERAAIDPGYRHDLDLVVLAIPPLASYLSQEDALGKSEWGKDGGLVKIQSLKKTIRELSGAEKLSTLSRARLAALYEDVTASGSRESDSPAPHWEDWLLQHLKHVPSSHELHVAFLAELAADDANQAPTLGPFRDAALQLVNSIFTSTECEGHIPTLAHFYGLIVDGARKSWVNENMGLPEDAANQVDVRLYADGIQAKLATQLIPPGYHMMDSHIVPDPSWTETLDFPILVAYGRAYASWLRLWSFIGHLDARIGSPLPQNNFPGHFVLTYWTPDRVRRAMSHPGHYTDLDMLVAALYPLRDWLTDGAEMIDGTREIRDELVTAVKEVFTYEDVPQITRARLAEILEDLE